jgi:hypothetical protein
MRPRSAWEAADLGVRLCQKAARPVYTCYAAVAIPAVALALASFEIASWLPGLLIWCAKPWLDRTVLFVLSRAAFGQPTTLGDLWRSQRQVWWQQLLLTWTLRRLSPWRSFTQPVYQLEGLPWSSRRKRVLQIRGSKNSPALLMTSAFSGAETSLTLALVSLVFWFGSHDISFASLLSDEQSAVLGFALSAAYALAVLFLEPFYVAAGFAMYLNRRAQLEAWDIEQELRRAFAN